MIQTKVLYLKIILIKILESRLPLPNIILIRKYEFAKYHLHYELKYGQKYISTAYVL